MGLLDGIGQLVGLNVEGLGLNISLNIGGRSAGWNDSAGSALSRRAPVRGAEPAPIVLPRSEDYSNIRESLILARSAVEDHAEVVQVPESEIHAILDKLKALEDEVSALLDSDGNIDGETERVKATAPELQGPPNGGSDKASEKHTVPEANDGEGAPEKSSSTPANGQGGTEDNEPEAEEPANTPKEKPGPEIPGTGMFKEKVQLEDGAEVEDDTEAEDNMETEVLTSTMESTTTKTKTRTTTVTVKPTTEPSEAAPAPAPPVAPEGTESRISEVDGAQFMELKQSSSGEVAEPSVSGAPVQQKLPAANNSSSPASLPGHIAPGPSTTRPVPEAPRPLQFNNKAVFTNTTTRAGFQTVTRQGAPDDGLGA